MFDFRPFVEQKKTSEEANLDSGNLHGLKSFTIFFLIYKQKDLSINKAHYRLGQII